MKGFFQHIYWVNFRKQNFPKALYLLVLAQEITP